jgi:hypothetical protein
LIKFHKKAKKHRFLTPKKHLFFDPKKAQKPEILEFLTRAQIFYKINKIYLNFIFFIKNTKKVKKTRKMGFCL